MHKLIIGAILVGSIVSGTYFFNLAKNEGDLEAVGVPRYEKANIQRKIYCLQDNKEYIWEKANGFWDHLSPYRINGVHQRCNNPGKMMKIVE